MLDIELLESVLALYMGVLCSICPLCCFFTLFLVFIIFIFNVLYLLISNI